MTLPLLTTLSVTTYGLPAPQGSKRHVGGGVMVESSKAVKPWREAVKYAALDALEAHPEWDRSTPAVGMQVVFTMPRPRSHYRTGKRSHELRADAPALHTKAPDLDKLLRSTWDALGQAGVFADDARVAQVYAIKTYPSEVTRPPTFPPALALDRPGAHLVLTARPLGEAL